MSQGTNHSRQAKADARPSQHISSIAHLFFDNTNEVKDSSGKAVERRFLMVGTGLDTCAPYTAAGLGHHLLDQSTKIQDRGETASALPIRQVFLGEPSPVCFSALSHLKENTYRPPLSDEKVPWQQYKTGPESVLRLFPGIVPSEDFSGGLVEGIFYLRHLDLPREAELSAFETSQLASQNSELNNDGVDSLLWCVRSGVANSLSLTSRLGRLLPVVRPREIHVLVFGGGGHGKNKTLHGKSNTSDAAVLRKCQRLVEYVAGDTPVYSRFMAVLAEERNFQLCALARELSLA